MDSNAENPLIRRALLELLQSAVNRHRDKGDGVSTYVTESVLQSQLALRGYPLPLERLRGQLFYLRDKDFVKLRETRAGVLRYMLWRITAAGTDVIEGSIAVPGIAGE